MASTKQQLVEALNAEIRLCFQCTDSKLEINSSENRLLGDGNVNAKIMLIGQNPSYYRKGTRILGSPNEHRQDQILANVFEILGTSRDGIYATNIMNCSTFENAVPKDDDVLHCKVWLDKLIQIIDPDVLILAGAVAAKAFHLKRGDIVTRVVAGQERLLAAVAHPAYIMRSPNLLFEYQESFGNIKEAATKFGTKPRLSDFV